MNEPHDPNRTVDNPSVPAGALDAGLTAGFEGPAEGPRSGLGATGGHGPGSASTVGPAAPPAADPSAGDLPAVPGYRVLREIARGGMGRVLAAHDLTLDREVALKILLPGANADRFVRESKITARLPHPGIPPVHALGTLADGSPFLAMKLIAGQTLSVELTSADRPRLLQAFAQVCQTIAYAHSRGVIHRDLKPHNVMVGAFGEVQVMDWGLAKDLTSREVADEPRSSEALTVPVVGPDANQTTDYQTRAGTVLGTPAYMAPEVATGNAATKAADVYGLGAILYTLLAGRPPYAGGTVADVRKRVTTTDPDLFVKTNASVPPALVAICRKAMTRNPDDRYPSADDVATEVRRWLADEPVSVYREPWTARAARWARRRKTTVVAAGVLLLTTAIAATVAALLVWQEQQHTKGEWSRAETEKGKATENADTAIRVVHDLSNYVRRTEFSWGREISDQERRTALDTALASYERLLAIRPDDAGVQWMVAQTHRFRANLCRFLNDAGEAEKSFREASRHYRELAAAHPEEPGYRQELALTSRDFALFVKTLGRLKESAETLDVSILLYEEFSRTSPDEADYQRELAIMMHGRAELDYELGNLADTELHARRSTELFAQLADKAAASRQPLDGMFRGMAEISLAIALRDLGRIDDALAVHNRAVERLGGLVKISATRDFLHHYYLAQAERAWTLARVPSRWATEVAELDTAIAGWEKLAKQFPQAPAYVRRQGTGTLYRGRLKALLGQREAAAADLSAAAKIFEGLVGKHPDIPVYRSSLGETYMALGQLEASPPKAAEWYSKAREMLEGAIQRSPENFQYRQAKIELDALTKMPKP
jgi:tetratricopeptide (TPR) repeat protein